MLRTATGAGAEIATRPDIARSITPDPDLRAAFDDGHHRFRATQAAVKGLT